MGAATRKRRRRRTRPRTSRSSTLVRLECITGIKDTNIDQLVFNTVQDGFLGGYLAAGMTKTGKVATFGGAGVPAP